MDIYKDSLFIQSGCLNKESRSFGHEFGDGSVFFVLSEKEELLDSIKTLVKNYKNKPSLEFLLKEIVLNFGSLLKSSEIFFLFIDTEETFHAISQNTPPIILKNKKNEISVASLNKNIFLEDIENHIFRFLSKDIASMIFTTNARLLNYLKDRSVSVFSKCELENIIRPLCKRAEDLELCYFLLNNTLKDKIKFAFSQKLSAQLEDIINYEADLEKILNDSYPDEKILNDNALTIFNELILNAFEHGVLEVNSQTKQEKIANGSYEEYIYKLQESKNSIIDVELIIYEQNLLKISIDDKGRGFEYSEYDCSEKNISTEIFHGRGVQMANMMSSLLYYEGNGSKVTFYINYLQIQKVHDYHHDEEEMLRKMSILYVEDDLFIRSQVSKIIQRMVKNLYIASDGEEGLGIFKMEHPDIVLTDIEMPNMNGLDMAEKIKDINPEQAILIMTAYNQDEKFLRAIDIGVDKYVIKPVKITQLKQSLLHSAKQIFYKKEAFRLLKEKEHNDMIMLADLQTKNKYTISQQTMAFEKQKLIIHDDSDKYSSNYRCKVFYKPLERLSGDIYGVFKIDDNRTVLYVIDSMGKGLLASVTAVLSAAYINRTLDIMILNNNFDFEKLIFDYQDYIRSYLLDDECLSFSMVYLDLQKRKFRYGSFGMYPIVIKNCETFEVIEHKCKNIPFMKFLPINPSAISGEIELPQVFELFLFSDGLVETEIFGMKELIYHLKKGEEEKEIGIFEKVIKEEFITDDDLTLIHFCAKCKN
ncbi:MAG: phosphoserine phosphatase RsbU/P [Campylobacterota bacterium]|nr:phosphoserine phosphatase RsbU/P [Campylobacterota bacterium]